MKRQTALLFVLGAWVSVPAAGVTLYFLHRTFTTSGEHAVAKMSAEELKSMELLSSINRGTSREHVYLALGSPSEDLYILGKWNGFGGPVVSQARVYFVDDIPTRIRWIKLGLGVIFGATEP